MVPLDKALVSSCRLPNAVIVTMSLTEAVWPQFAKQVFGVQSVLGIRLGKIRSELVPQGSGRGISCFFR